MSTALELLGLLEGNDIDLIAVTAAIKKLAADATEVAKKTGERDLENKIFGAEIKANALAKDLLNGKIKPQKISDLPNIIYTLESTDSFHDMYLELMKQFARKLKLMKIDYPWICQRTILEPFLHLEN